MKPIVEHEIPDASAMMQTDHYVAFFGLAMSVLRTNVTTAFQKTSVGEPVQSSSSSPIIPKSRNLRPLAC